MKRYTVAVLVNNQFGVLNRVTSMFRRRQFNISTLTVSETETGEFSRITVVFDGEETAKQQCFLPDACSGSESLSSASTPPGGLKSVLPPVGRRQPLPAIRAFGSPVGRATASEA